MRRLDLLDYARGFAISAVILFHYFFNGINNGKISSIGYIPEMVSIAKYGYLGVELFFMISGYVIFISALKKTSSEFFISRFIRLYPLYFLGVLFTSFFACCLNWGNTKINVDFFQMISNLTLSAKIFGYEMVDGVYWTLIYELKFYFLVYFILLFGYRKNIYTIFKIWAILIFVFSLLNLSYLPYMDGNFSFFVAGSMFAIVKIDKSKLNYFLLFLLFLSSVSFSITQSNYNELHKLIFYDEFIILAIVTMFFLFFIVLNIEKIKNINLPFASFVGAMTYPLYLIHAYFGYMFISRFGNDSNKFYIISFLIVIIILVSYLMHYFVEVKYRSNIKNFSIRMLSGPLKKIETVFKKIKYFEKYCKEKM